MVLKREDGKKIQKNYKDIVRDIKAELLVDDFVTEGIFSVDDDQRIRSKVTDGDKNREFLRLLINGPPQGYKLFIDLISADDIISELADRIDSTVVEEESTKPQTIESWLGDDRIPIEKQKIILADVDLLHFSRSLNPAQLSTVGTILGFSPVDIQNIEHRHVRAPESASYELLVKWRNKCGHAATAGAFLEKLLQAWESFPDSVHVDKILYAVDKLKAC